MHPTGYFTELTKAQRRRLGRLQLCFGDGVGEIRESGKINWDHHQWL